MWSGGSSAWLGKPKRQAAALAAPDPAHLSVAPRRQGGACLDRCGRHTVHGMPQIGEISPGLWLLGGFGGHGLNTTAMGGEMLARAIVEGDTRLGDVLAVRAGLGRRRARPRGAAVFRLVAARARKRAGGAGAKAGCAAAAVPKRLAGGGEPPRQPPPEPRRSPEPLVTGAGGRSPCGAGRRVPEPVIEQSAEVTEGQSGAAAPAIPSEPAEPVAGSALRRRRSGASAARKRRKKPGAPQTLKDVSEQMVERDEAPATACSRQGRLIVSGPRAAP